MAPWQLGATTGAQTSLPSRFWAPKLAQRACFGSRASSSETGRGRSPECPSAWVWRGSRDLFLLTADRQRRRPPKLGSTRGLLWGWLSMEEGWLRIMHTGHSSAAKKKAPRTRLWYKNVRGTFLLTMVECPGHPSPMPNQPQGTSLVQLNFVWLRGEAPEPLRASRRPACSPARSPQLLQFFRGARPLMLRLRGARPFILRPRDARACTRRAANEYVFTRRYIRQTGAHPLYSTSAFPAPD
jgi:hypothetical protein